MPEHGKTERYYLVSEAILPEAVLKTIQAKEMLAKGEFSTVHEAVEHVGLSRSAFYKYKDGIFALNRLQQERIVTLSMDLLHESGVLSRVLRLIAEFGGNVLTINQTIPLQGLANVLMSVDTTEMGDKMPLLIQALEQDEGVRKPRIAGQG